MAPEDKISAYLALREELDKRCEVLNVKHEKHLACRKGCDSCCENISVFPVEFDAIKQELNGKLKELNLNRSWNRFRKSCVFLVDGSCSIYDSRPFICRTQGLPLLYQNAEGTSYELSVCHLNFKGIDVDYFNIENAIYMPEYNSRLFMLNQSYTSQYKKRIPLFKLLK